MPPGEEDFEQFIKKFIKLDYSGQEPVTGRKKIPMTRENWFGIRDIGG